MKFFATWCGPCKAFGPVLAEFAAENGIELREVDIDEHSEVLAEYGIKSVPTTAVIKDGAVVKTIAGAKPKSVLAKELAEFI